jgi:hypothetical protein
MTSDAKQSKRSSRVVAVSIAIVSIALFAPSSGSAKCISDRYVVSGQIGDKSGNPLKSATVVVTWPRGGSTEVEQQLTTANNLGRYRLEIWVDRFSGEKLFGGDICDFLIKSITVEANAYGFAAQKTAVPTTAEELEQNFRLERLRLRK